VRFASAEARAAFAEELEVRSRGSASSTTTRISAGAFRFVVAGHPATKSQE
jgi:hypothetical protein